MSKLHKKGFTLVEILVVITIIALLTAIGVTSYTTLNKQARDARRKSDIANIQAALEMYKSANNGYPTATSSLSPTYIIALPTDPKTKSNYTYNGGGTCGTTCSSYTMTVTLESGKTYTATPLGTTEN